MSNSSSSRINCYGLWQHLCRTAVVVLLKEPRRKPRRMKAETIAKLCLDKYNELPKTGKPIGGTQWTVIAGIVLHNALKDQAKVVALGLGTKCIGKNKMCNKGFILNDSHAEILARRAFIRYIYHQMKDTLKSTTEDSSCILSWNAKKQIYVIKPELSFHFFSSQAPCGDACILEETDQTESDTEVDEVVVHPNKRQKMNENNQTVYTGGKLLDDDNCCNSNNRDRMAQTIGALRIKPGKGERTLSMSCSDKMSKWCFLGAQGALIYVLLEKPIYFSTMNFGHGSNLNALKRAIYKRWKSKCTFSSFANNAAAFHYHKPLVRVCNESVNFGFSQNISSMQPCPNGLVWCDISDGFRSYEAIVNGKRQGCTKKAYETAEAATQISKYKLFQEFINVLRGNNNILNKCSLTEAQILQLRYSDAKNLAKSYQKYWTIVKTEVFRMWTHKPTDFLQFSLNTVKS